MFDTKFETEVAILGALDGTPMPIDEKIIGGVALSPGLVEPKTLRDVAERLNSLFDFHDIDSTGEAGDCIAYGVELGEGEVYLLEESLLHTASSRNHGMSELDRGEIADESLSLWLGQTATRKFTLRRYSGPVPLNNGDFPTGNVYSLLSKPL